MSVTGDLEFHRVAMPLGGRARPVILDSGTWTVQIKLPEPVLTLTINVPTAANGLNVADDRTLTEPAYSLSGPTSGRQDHAWMTLVALWVTISENRDLIAEEATLSQAVNAAAKLWCGHGSNDWVQARFIEAARHLGLRPDSGRDAIAQIIAREYLTQQAVTELYEDIRPFGPFGRVTPAIF